VSKLRIDIWSDIACPWCYVGKRRLEQALAGFAHASEVEIVWRAFELDPSAPRVRDPAQSYADRLGRKYGTSTAQAQAMIDRMVATAAGDGIAMRFDHIRPGNTFDAHRLLHLAYERRSREVQDDQRERVALERGKQDALKERLLRAYLTEGQAIGEPDVLRPLACEVGLDEREVDDVLGGDRYASEVRQDEAIARELGVTGVPFFVLAGRLGVSGAQPAEVLRGALDRAWSELRPEAEPIVEGAVCGPDGCD
jgi:predicted DsbA family dithiol-disulfide isomerase